MPAFYTWQFPALNAPTSRTLPTRLSDVVNVKDWGAVGNGSNDDSSAIQAAIDYAIDHGGGKVFFPGGNYAGTGTTYAVGTNDVNKSINGIELIGSGWQATMIAGAVSKGGRTYDLISRAEGMQFTNGLTLTGAGVSVHNCKGGSFNASAATGCAFYTCFGEGGGSQPSNSSTPTLMPSAYFMALGNSCAAIDCRCVGGFDVAFALSGNGPSVIGGSVEVCNTAYRVGWSPAGGGTSVKAIGATLMGLNTERNRVCIDLYNVEGCLVTCSVLHSTDGPNGFSPILNASWSGGTVTVNTDGAHNLPVGDTLIVVGMPSGWVTSGQAWAYVLATRVDSDTFTYPLAANPGAWPGGSNWVWQYGSEYALRVRDATECCLMNLVLDVPASQASVDFSYGGATVVQRNNVIIDCITNPSRNFGFILPAVANRAGWTFQNFFVGANQLALIPGVSEPETTPLGKLAFANLPGGASNQDGPYESQEFDINNGQKSGGGTAAWDDTVEAGVTGHYKVRYNGSVWKRIG